MKNQLEIHHVSVSGGDATIIAVYDPNELNKIDAQPKELVLIDAGNSHSDLVMIMKHKTKHFGDIDFTRLILSHRHKDHMGAMHALETTNSLFYRGMYHKKSPKFKVKEEKIIVEHDPGAPYIDLGGGVSMHCVCTGAFPIAKNYIHPEFDYQKIDEENLKKKRKELYNAVSDDNDFSLAWILNFNEFHYFTAGDLSGSDASGYSNVEAALIELFNNKSFQFHGKKMDVIKANHHGSKFSNFGLAKKDPVGSDQSPFLQVLNPGLIVIPCNNRIPLPDKEFFMRVDNTLKNCEIYLVNEFERGAENGALKELKIEKYQSLVKNIGVKELEYTLFKKKFKHKFYLNYNKDKTEKFKFLKKKKEQEIDCNLLPVLKIVKADKDTSFKKVTNEGIIFIRGTKGERVKTFGKIPINVYYQLIVEEVDINSDYYDPKYVDKTYLGHLWEFIGLERDNIPDVMDSFRKGDENDPYHIQYSGEFDLDSMSNLNTLLKNLNVDPNKFKLQYKEEFEGYVKRLWSEFEQLKTDKVKRKKETDERKEKKEKALKKLKKDTEVNLNETGSEGDNLTKKAPKVTKKK